MTMMFSEGERQESAGNCSEQIWEYSSPIETRYWQEIFLRSGLYILLDKFKFQEHFVRNVFPEKLWPEFAFQVSGTRRLVNGTYHEAGQNFLAIGRYPEGSQEVVAQEQILKVDIHIKPDLLAEYLANYTQKIPPGLKQLLEGCDEQFYFRCGTTTPAMQVALHQILNCPYQGGMRNLYLESKALELIALRLEAAIADCKVPSNFENLSPSDIESIHHAKDILCRNFNNPPSLLSLARQVGLNDCKFKQGFQQVFGTTAFGYLRDYRMEKAQQLLLEKEMNVNEVVRAVGYASRSAFLTAFKEKFGVSPSDYLRR